MRKLFSKKSRYYKYDPKRYFKVALTALFISFGLLHVANILENELLKIISLISILWFSIDIVIDLITLTHKSGGTLYANFYNQNKKKG